MIYRKIQITVFLLCAVLFSCGISNEQAKQGLVKFLQENHQGKYQIKTFKKQVKEISLEPDMFWVELELKENSNVIISFQWDANRKALYLPKGKHEVASIDSIARKKLSRERMVSDLKKSLGSNALNISIDRSYINLRLDREPEIDFIDSLSIQIKNVLEQYPQEWNTEARVNISTSKNETGFLQLIVKPKHYDDSNLKEQFKPNAVLVNAFGSEKATDVTQKIFKTLEKRTRSRQMLKMWINQQNLNDLYVAVEVEKQNPRAPKNLPTSYGVYLAKWNAKDFKVDKLRFFNYASISKRGIVQFLEGRLPEAYQIRTYTN
ncbi:hypothetical protein SAMN04487906_0728 [Zhouia amylolytica]|uniref:Lipoprotein n=1 Tax=Zhouia amylolytica TaxID=376730 RepID=A0A1I6QM13_9FLAO|nr:hypothetical protein [Zhouia amylolytica]MCQ0111967.1 hypothetical protein [Zhouia amylolytica]SFS53489.1 hypothetical protein SAMN04487906_0728 [Zhouia amylolytica]